MNDYFLTLFSITNPKDAVTTSHPSSPKLFKSCKFFSNSCGLPIPTNLYSNFKIYHLLNQIVSKIILKSNDVHWCDYMTSLEHILPGITNIRYAIAARQGKGVQGEKELPMLQSFNYRRPALGRTRP